jgi:HPt (histidine-containing phosphotransfer) domain-containing protein
VSSELPLLDEQVLASLREDFASTGDLGELASIIRNFLERAAREVGTIAQAVADSDAEAARQAGHKLKGSSRTLGASRLGAAAAQVESAAAAGDLAAATDALRELESVFALTRAALAEVAGTAGPS